MKIFPKQVVEIFENGQLPVKLYSNAPWDTDRPLCICVVRDCGVV